jgi:Ser/Thr protein kinase RdoA (MazF antagonist)
VTHNDTKINNILFDQETGKAVCVIDLDTVMPGSMLYDFGDALRMGGSTGAEDETDLSKVWFDETAFEAFAKGYLSELKDDLTETELELLPFSVKLMTYECGIRFLTDYLNGDTYFKIHREHHNLERARNQFKLVADIAGKEERLSAMIKEIKEKY